MNHCPQCGKHFAEDHFCRPVEAQRELAAAMNRLAAAIEKRRSSRRLSVLDELFAPHMPVRGDVAER